MALMTWSDSLSVGVDVLDADHRRLFALINELHDAIQSGSEPVPLASAFDRLTEYCRDHFAREEDMMAAGAYPELEAHRAEHVELTAQVHSLRGRFLNGAEDDLTTELLVLFKTWLTSHIRISDMRYGPYVSRLAR